MNCGSVVAFFYCDQPGAGCHVSFCELFAKGFRAKARRVAKRFVANVYLTFIVSVCLLHTARLFYCGARSRPHFCGRRLVYTVLVSPRPPWPTARARIRASFRARRLYAEPVYSQQCSSCGGGVRPWCQLQHLHQRKGGGGGFQGQSFSVRVSAAGRGATSHCGGDPRGAQR